MKKCCRCKIEKPKNAEYFLVAKHRRDGFHPRCRECERERGKKYYNENPILMIWVGSKKNARFSNYKSLADWFDNDFNAFKNWIENLPKICQNKKCSAIENLVLDHNHDTGEPYGWLCQTCNRVEGLLKSDSERRHGLGDYIKGTRK